MFVHETSLGVQIGRSHYCRTDWTSCSLTLVILRCVHVQDMQKIINNGGRCLCDLDLGLNQNSAMTTSGQIQPHQHACVNRDRRTHCILHAESTEQEIEHKSQRPSSPSSVTRRLLVSQSQSQ
jgi:hypothetical protein